jgi:two-component system sensor histidine kinase/response regulator
VLDPSAWEGRPGHVLLAEDNPLNQRVATAMLENLGFRIDIVADGAEAVKAATMTPYRAILMDCQIPGLDGYQATAEIRRLEGVSRRTPVIAVTASDSDLDQKRCLAAGMDDYLTKPLSLKALAEALHRWAPRRSDPTMAVASAEVLPATRLGVVRSPDTAGLALDAQVVGRLERLGKTAGEDLMGQLSTLFLADADAAIVALREALAGDDADALIRSAHTLSGASANLGATDLARLCAALAMEGASGDLIGGGMQLEAVEAELGRVRFALGARTSMP